MFYTTVGTSALQCDTYSSESSFAQQEVALTIRPREIFSALGLEISYFHTGYICMIARVHHYHNDAEKWYRYDNEHSWIEIDPEQLWFWTEKWQAGERRAEEDLKRGNYKDFDNLDDFFDN